MNRNTIHLGILSAVLLISAISGYLYWKHTEIFPSTTDAYVNAHTINVAAQVSGPVIKTYVSNGQLVKQGQLLLDINPQPFIIAVQRATASLNLAEQKVAGEISGVKEATAQVAEQRNALILAEQNAHRILPLVRSGKISKTEGDQITEKLNVARAALQAAQQELAKEKNELGSPDDNNAEIKNAQAALAQAKLDLQHTHIFAASSGRLINFTTRTGDMITSGADLFSLIEQKDWWVDANFKETQLKRIQLGQSASVYIDLYPGRHFQGIVTNISQGSGSAFALLPAENATGNWVKVTQRFPVKIKIVTVDNKYPLRVGASANVTVNTSSFTNTTTP